VLATRTVTLAELQPRLAALDVVFAAEASELEARIALHAAATRPDAVTQGAVVRLRTRSPGGAERVELPAAIEAARAVREAIAGARPVTAADLSAPERAPAGSPDAAELEQRAGAALDALRATAEALAVTLAEGSADALRHALLAAAGFGVAGTVPPAADEREALRDRAATALGEIERRIATAEALPADGGDRAAAVLATVFGPAFRALGVWTVTGAPDELRLDPRFGRSEGLLAPDPLAPATWLQRAARVHDGARRLADVLLYAEALSGRDALELAVDQLPAHDGDRWIALPFDGSPAAGRLSFAAAVPFGAPTAGQAFAALMLDEWREVLPAREQTTAVAFHFDRPNACAPNAIIVAVPARDEDWTLPVLEETVMQTLELAQARTVDIDALEGGGHFLPAIQLAHNPRGATIATDLKGGVGCPVT
jgi:hypothetical protein